MTSVPTLPSRLVRHVLGLWPRWPLLPALPFLGWAAYCLLRGERRWELALVVFFGGVLPYIGPRTKRFYLGVLPLGIMGLVYDMMRFVRDLGLTPERIHVCDLRDIDRAWFGVQMNGERVTLHEWLAPHESLPLDILFAIPYGTFLGAAFFFAAFLYARDYPAMRRFTGAFLAMNLAAFVTYHLYPAAPPWYYHAHGCVADLGARASEGPRLARVDAWLGFPYFHGFYGRATEVFGAVPSLHAAYPVVIALDGWRPFGALRSRLLGSLLRAASLVFIVWMWAAAVYLDHHWVVDIIVGTTYGLITFALLRLATSSYASRSAERLRREATVSAGSGVP